ncbi:hypothetical protein VH22019_00015 [Vibrio phage VH2_2019]|nr:hypothetical protein VH22019_00015 [Vibrio phage VH2_2019]
MRVTTIQAPFLAPLYELVRSLNCHTTVMLAQSQFRYGATHNQVVAPSIAPSPISIPVQKNSRAYIGEMIPVDAYQWFKKFRKQVTQAYKKSPNWDKVQRFLVMLEPTAISAGKAKVDLAFLNSAMTLYIYLAFELDELFPEWTMVGDNTLCNPRPKDPSAYVSACAIAADATEYVGGKNAMDAYLNVDLFEDIQIFYQDYTVPEELAQYLPHESDARYSALEFLAWIPSEHYPTLLRDVTHVYTKATV